MRSAVQIVRGEEVEEAMARMSLGLTPAAAPTIQARPCRFGDSCHKPDCTFMHGTGRSIPNVASSVLLASNSLRVTSIACLQASKVANKQ